jgi:hypothetical protein
MPYNALSLIGDMSLGMLPGAGQKPLYYMDPLNATKLTLNPGKVDQITRIGKGRTTNGTAKNVMTKVGEAANFTVANDEFNAKILAIQLRGAVQKLSVASGTVADEDLTVKQDEWVPLLGAHLDAAVTITNAAGSTTYVEETHYVMNRRMGMVKFLSAAAGGPADGATVKVDYVKAVHNFTRVMGSTTLPSRYAVKYDGVNQASGKDCLLYIPQAVIAPEGNLELITEAFVSGNLIITPELVAGEAAAYYYDEDD